MSMCSTMLRILATVITSSVFSAEGSASNGQPPEPATAHVIPGEVRSRIPNFNCLWAGVGPHCLGTCPEGYKGIHTPQVLQDLIISRSALTFGLKKCDKVDVKLCCNKSAVLRPTSTSSEDKDNGNGNDNDNKVRRRRAISPEFKRKWKEMRLRLRQRMADRFLERAETAGARMMDAFYDGKMLRTAGRMLLQGALLPTPVVKLRK